MTTPNDFQQQVYPAQPGYPPPVQPAAKPAANQKKVIAAFIGGAVVLLAAATIVSLTLVKDVPQRMTIDFGLFDTSGGTSCASGGDGGYNDIAPGMPVTVKDEEGTVLASTTLPSKGHESSVGCIWTMHVLVPDDAKQYGVEGGRRGTVTYSHSQMVKKDWKVELSVGP